jgi:hypothetical protein
MFSLGGATIPAVGAAVSRPGATISAIGAAIAPVRVRGAASPAATGS